MNIIPTAIKEVLILESKVFGDHRGFFMETYSKRVYESFGLHYEFVQDNHSLSREVGVLRGLHYQLSPHTQTKVVRVVRGEILDVAVDIRKGSPTYGQHVVEVLSAENKRQLLVPKGFAHGFVTLVPDTEVIYKVDEFYTPAAERCIRWNDPALAIEWRVTEPILIDRDRNASLLKDVENTFIYEGV